VSTSVVFFFFLRRSAAVAGVVGRASYGASAAYETPGSLLFPKGTCGYVVCLGRIHITPFVLAGERHPWSFREEEEEDGDGGGVAHARNGAS